MISNLLCRIIGFLFLLFRLEDLIVFVSSWFHHLIFHPSCDVMELKLPEWTHRMAKYGQRL